MFIKKTILRRADKMANIKKWTYVWIITYKVTQRKVVLAQMKCLS